MPLPSQSDAPPPSIWLAAELPLGTSTIGAMKLADCEPVSGGSVEKFCAVEPVEECDEYQGVAGQELARRAAPVMPHVGRLHELAVCDEEFGSRLAVIELAADPHAP